MALAPVSFAYGIGGLFLDYILSFTLSDRTFTISLIMTITIILYILFDTISSLLLLPILLLIRWSIRCFIHFYVADFICSTTPVMDILPLSSMSTLLITIALYVSSPFLLQQALTGSH